ncbi:MAG: hypothetical protein EHM14_08575 [Methanothrix sp.]|nr:MAG: hypothetical protein EHM14_08575 [Methanothrix sp.]
MRTDNKNDEKEDISAEEIKGAGNEDMDWDECVRDLNRLAIDLSDYEPNFMSDFEEAKRLIGMADRTRNYLSDAERDPERYYLGPDFGANILEELDSSISDNSNEEYDDPSTEDD